MHNQRKHQCKLGRGIPSSKVHSIPIFCALALLLLGIIWINPGCVKDLGLGLGFSNDGSSNNDSNGYGTNKAYAADGSSMARSSTVSPSLSMVIDNNTTMNPTYVEPGVVAYRSHIVKVSASDIMNYILQLTAASGATTTLNNGSTTIAGTSSVVGKDMSTNTWGWSWSEVNSDNSEQTYYALPAYGSTGANISTGLLESGQASDTNTAEFTKKLTFATNLGTDSPSGHYTTTAMLSLAATPKQLVFDGIETMQEMTSTICANAAENDTTRLRDSRDGKYYWVAKLKDGNCWMTQNLALDLDTNKTLTPADTDITANWTPENSTQKGDVVAIEKSSDAHEYQFYTYSYNPGLFLRSPISDISNLCKAADDSKITNLKQCSSFDWKDVSSLRPSVVLMDGALGKSAIDEGRGVYDAHYLTGNYYSFNAGTAGAAYNLVAEYDSDDQTVAHLTNTSICPKNWRLPMGYPGQDASAESDFNKLSTIYPSSRDDITGNPVIAPLYYPLAGTVRFDIGEMSAGWDGYSMANGGEGYDSELTGNLAFRTSYQYATGLFIHMDGSVLLYSGNQVNTRTAVAIRCVAR